jgi:hypothetical protein
MSDNEDKRLMFCGFIRTMPDVETFICPVFNAGAGRVAIQKFSRGVVEEFDFFQRDEAFEAAEAPVFAEIGKPGVVAFNAGDSIIVGTFYDVAKTIEQDAGLLKRLEEHQNSTFETVLDFLKTTKEYSTGYSAASAYRLKDKATKREQQRYEVQKISSARQIEKVFLHENHEDEFPFDWVQKADERLLVSCTRQISEMKKSQREVFILALMSRYYAPLVSQAAAFNGDVESATHLANSAFSDWLSGWLHTDVKPSNINFGHSDGRMTSISSQLRRSLIGRFSQESSEKRGIHSDVFSDYKKRLEISKDNHSLPRDLHLIDQFRGFRENNPVPSAILIWIYRDHLSLNEVAETLDKKPSETLKFLDKVQRQLYSDLDFSATFNVRSSRAGGSERSLVSYLLVRASGSKVKKAEISALRDLYFVLGESVDHESIENSKDQIISESAKKIFSRLASDWR